MKLIRSCGRELATLVLLGGVEQVCLIFRNTWAEILELWNYMQILDPWHDFLILGR